MKEQIRRATNFTKSALFTIVIHAVLITALLASLWWPFSETKIERGSVKPIQAQAISAEKIQQQIDRKQQQEAEKKKEEQRKLDEIKKKQEDEKKKLEELEQKRIAEEVRIEKEKQQKLATEEKKKEDVEKHKAEEKQKQQAEQKKAEEEKQRKEKKRQQIEAEEIEAEAKRKRETELREQLEAEQRVQTQANAENALGSIVDRIAIAVENQWRPPLNYSGGLEAVIQAKVARNGEVLSANVIKSSGDHFFDRSAEVATKKASPLPFPSEPKYYEFIKVFNIRFKPNDF